MREEGGYHIKVLRVAPSAPTVNHLINFGVSQFVCVSGRRVTHLAPDSLSVNRSLAWGRLFLHLPFLSFALPVTTSSIQPSLLCSSLALLPCQKLVSHLEGQFISSIIYTIMLLENIPHELLIRVRLYVNYTPSHRMFVLMHYLCVSSLTSHPSLSL